MASPPRYLTDHDFKNYIPVHVVWEITLACDLKCLHCGSRAGKKRPGELSTSECLEVVDSLAGLGTREITLIGGEAYLRRDWLQIIRRICDHGIYVATQTGGHNFNPKRLSQAVEAGLGGLGVSLDGLEPLHDKLRNVPGSFKRAVDTLHRAHEAGLNVSVNTQIGSEVIPQLPELMDLVIRLGAKQWQIQITVAMGNAVDHPELLLQPYRVLELMPVLAKLYKEGAERGLLLVMGNKHWLLRSLRAPMARLRRRTRALGRLYRRTDSPRSRSRRYCQRLSVARYRRIRRREHSRSDY